VKKIKCTLGTLKNAISEIDAYQKEIDRKNKEFLYRLALIGGKEASVRFSQAMYAGLNDVKVSVEEIENGYAIIANGSAVGFIEFGTATRHENYPNDSLFTPPPRGSYGKGQGDSSKYPNGWVYRGEQGNAGRPIRDNLYRTYGNPPARALYDSGKTMREEILTIAKEVFGND
jgi:hypothetical protein